jgi:hypothetical protein
LYEEFSYGKYQLANKSGEITWISGVCKIATIKTKEGLDQMRVIMEEEF